MVSEPIQLSYASGVDSNFHDGLSHRHHSNHDDLVDSNSNLNFDSSSTDLEDIINQTRQLSISSQKKYTSNKFSIPSIFIRIINPLILTSISAFIRLYQLDKSNEVVWDEAHFGKFGSHYLKHEFYFDVHPPLGKLLVGLSGYLAGYDGSFSFESGQTFPDNCNFVIMRCFNCIFGILCTPLAYKTALTLGYSQWTVWLISLMVNFEMISLVLSKFILLDSMLLFFTVLCYFCLINIHRLRLERQLLSLKGISWLIVTGISIGCVCSVKWVGLFVTCLIGIYIIYDLLIKFYQTTSKNMEFSTYLYHWISRIVTLIIIPFIIYLACFKVHFQVLNSSGPGDGSISTLLQASLKGNTIQYGPRSVGYGSLVTLRSQGLSPNLIHSHSSKYPEGSQQQQVTTYGFKDENNEFLIEFDLQKTAEGHAATLIIEEDKPDNTTAIKNPQDYTTLVKDGDTIRLIHKETGCLLHSHSIGAPILKNHFEVSCYADLDHSDLKDEWVIEIQGQEVSPSPFYQNEPIDELHPISTNFRLRHKVLGCYLATTGYSYPAWGFQQGEVICKHSYMSKDKNTWWNFEDHVNEFLPSLTEDYIPPKPRFWKEFILLNYGMMASNNALVPDADKFDKLSSEWWEWPILHSGLRMCGWSADDVKYFMIGHPFINWFSTASIPIVIIYLIVILLLWQRQVLSFSIFDTNFNYIISGAVLPLLGWILHYLPFVIMGRVTYLHHYVPALYFAIFVAGFVMETLIVKKCNKYFTAVVYLASYITIIGGFWYLKDLVFGMEGPTRNFKHLKVLNSWMV